MKNRLEALRKERASVRRNWRTFSGFRGQTIGSLEKRTLQPFDFAGLPHRPLFLACH